MTISYTYDYQRGYPVLRAEAEARAELFRYVPPKMEGPVNVSVRQSPYRDDLDRMTVTMELTCKP